MYNSSSVCAVSSQARAICAQRASKERHRFLVGTCSLHESNELSVLQYSEDSNHFEAAAVYSHPDQIWAMDASPVDASLVVTSRQSQNCSKSITVWKMPNQQQEDIEDDNQANQANYNNDALELTEVTTFNQSQKASIIRSIRWHNTENKLIGVDNKLLTVWDTVTGKQCGVLPLEYDSNSSWESGTVAWDPHSPRQCAVGIGRSLQIVDSREMEGTAQRLNAHDETIRDVDYNPNQPSLLITAGDDRKVKFWDTRKLASPVKTLAGHSHWTWCARFNPYHDQLVVSGGSDNLVNLWRIASCSSSPWIGSDDPAVHDPPDIKVRGMDQHEESVYGVAWSPADAWIYCSLSFDGRAIVNHVPSTEKYKILL